MAADHEIFILEALQNLGKEVSACTQAINDLDKRMYNGGGGDIPTLKKELLEVKALAQKTESRLNKHRAYVAGYAAGVSGIVSGIALLVREWFKH